MSAESLAAFRRSVGPELAQLAEEHIQHEFVTSPFTLYVVLTE